MSRITCLLLLLTLTPGAAPADEPLPFTLPVPDGWRTETIPFPLEFAPELDYEGLEELRFSPGMFNAESEDFWSYGFVWWVPLVTKIDAESLSSDLETYFRGLSRAVAASNGFDASQATYRATMDAVTSGDGGHPVFRGEAETLDAFVTREQVKLNVRVELVACPQQQRLAALFELSPQPAEHEVWKVLAQIRGGFACTAPDSGP